MIDDLTEYLSIQLLSSAYLLIGSWWQQAKRGIPDVSLTIKAFQFLLGEPKVIPSQMRHVISAVSLGSNHKREATILRAPPDVRAPYPMSTAKLSQPTQETCFNGLKSRSSSDYSKLMTIAED